MESDYVSETNSPSSTVHTISNWSQADPWTARPDATHVSAEGVGVLGDFASPISGNDLQVRTTAESFHGWTTARNPFKAPAKSAMRGGVLRPFPVIGVAGTVDRRQSPFPQTEPETGHGSHTAVRDRSESTPHFSEDTAIVPEPVAPAQTSHAGFIGPLDSNSVLMSGVGDDATPILSPLSPGTATATSHSSDRDDLLHWLAMRVEEQNKQLVRQEQIIAEQVACLTDCNSRIQALEVRLGERLLTASPYPPTLSGESRLMPFPQASEDCYELRSPTQSSEIPITHTPAPCDCPVDPSHFA